MRCPSCKIENPPTAKRCDCGYDLTSIHTVVHTAESKRASGIAQAVWVLPIIGALAATFELATNWDAQQSAPQQAALAGFALCLVIIPYCLARAIAGLMGE